MSDTLASIPWDLPVVMPTEAPAWFEECRRESGVVQHVQRYIAPLPWLRKLSLDAARVRLIAAPERALNLAHLITSQENSCRYCLGSARAQMRLMGYSEDFLRKIERDAQLAGADEAERAMMLFARNLARSNPRPARSDCEALQKLGYSRLAVLEIAYVVAMTCMLNRVATFLAVPLETEFEAYPSSLRGRLMRTFPFLGPFLMARMRMLPTRPPPPTDGPFGKLVGLLEDMAGAWPVHEALQGVFASDVLPRRTKAWMFAVVAKSLRCNFWDEHSRQLLVSEGVAAAAIDPVLTSLASPSLDAREALLLPWTRETVHYKTDVMQRRAHELAQKLSPVEVLEAIGVAALANASVRLAMLVQ